MTTSTHRWQARWVPHSYVACGRTLLQHLNEMRVGTNGMLRAADARETAGLASGPENHEVETAVTFRQR
jgi:hypothetical protein